jgi:hypothetical protein
MMIRLRKPYVQVRDGAGRVRGMCQRHHGQWVLSTEKHTDKIYREKTNCYRRLNPRLSLQHVLSLDNNIRKMCSQHLRYIHGIGI